MLVSVIREKLDTYRKHVFIHGVPANSTWIRIQKHAQSAHAELLQLNGQNHIISHHRQAAVPHAPVIHFVPNRVDDPAYDMIACYRSKVSTITTKNAQEINLLGQWKPLRW